MHDRGAVFLSTLLRELSLGLVMRFSGGFVAAVLVQHFILNPALDAGTNRYPLPIICFASGMLLALFTALLRTADDSENESDLPLTLMVASIASGCLVTLAVRRVDHVDRTLLSVLGCLLFGSTIVSCIGLMKRRGWACGLLHGSCLFAIIAFAFFEYGEQSLLLERHDERVIATLSNSRWGGQRLVRHQELDHVVEVEDAHFSKRYADHGDGLVLREATGGDELFIAGQPVWSPGIQEFLHSSASEALFTRDTSSALRCLAYWAAGAVLVAIGLRPRESPRGLATRQTPIAGFAYAHAGVAITAWLAMLLAGIFQFQNDQRVAATEIEKLGGEVERKAELRVDDATLVSGCDVVRIVDRRFDDQRLGQLVPLVKTLAPSALYLRDTQVTDRGVMQLEDCDSLILLDLRNTDITDAILPLAKKLSLRSLDLRATKIVANDFRDEDLQTLEYLSFTDSDFSRRSFNHLVRLGRLKRVHIETMNLSRDDLSFWDNELTFEVNVTSFRDQPELESTDELGY